VKPSPVGQGPKSLLSMTSKQSEIVLLAFALTPSNAPGSLENCCGRPQVSPHFFINEFNKLKLSSWPILPRSLRQLEPVRLHKTVFCRFPPTDQALYK